MFEDYRNRVLLTYKEKKESKALSPKLTSPTPKNLKDECLVAIKSRIKKKDESLIKDFFNSGNESTDYSPSIRKFELDRFRPLVKFLNEKIERTDPNNVELLAWLIDFEPRPYDHKVDYTIYLAPPAGEPPVPPILPVLPLLPQEPTIKTRRISKKIVWSSAILCLLSSGVYIYANQERTAYICQYSTGKRYHLNPNCPTLKNCGGKIVSTTVEEAEKNGKTLCSYDIGSPLSKSKRN